MKMRDFIFRGVSYEPLLRIGEVIISELSVRHIEALCRTPQRYVLVGLRLLVERLPASTIGIVAEISKERGYRNPICRDIYRSVLFGCLCGSSPDPISSYRQLPYWNLKTEADVARDSYIANHPNFDRIRQ